jgi:hypothetical protein
VIHLRRVHRLDEGDVVHNRAEMRQEPTKPPPALAMLPERHDRRQHSFALLPLSHRAQPLIFMNRLRQLLPAKFFHLRLVIEHVDVRRSSILQQVNDMLHLRRMMRQIGQATELLLLRRGGFGRETLFRKQRGERWNSQTEGSAAEELTASHHDWLLSCHEIQFKLGNATDGSIRRQ